MISTWYDRRIEAGEPWRTRIDAALEAADIILALVSVDYLVSDYILEVEMKRALERHQAGEARVIPIILRPAEWSRKTPIGNLQALPRDGKPVTTWDDQDEAWLDVARGIQKAAEELRSPGKRRTGFRKTKS